MNVLIRADANSEMGSGHILRMIALMDAAVESGSTVCFASIECSPSISDRILARKGNLHHLSAGVIGSAQDARETLQFVSENHFDWIILDGYAFDHSYQLVFKNQGIKILKVDDFQFDEPVISNILLNQNIGVQSSDYSRVASNTMILCGAEYSLLRKEFWSANRSAVSANSQNILITFGGSDPVNATEVILDYLQRHDVFDHCNFRLLIGASNRSLDELKLCVNNSKRNLQFQIDAQNMPEQYEWADAIICAVGGTTWEWMRFGLKAAIIPIADNQMKLADVLVNMNYALQIGCLFEGKIILDKNKTDEFLYGNSPNHSLPPIDARGAFRVLEAMGEID